MGLTIIINGIGGLTEEIYKEQKRIEMVYGVDHFIEGYNPKDLGLVVMVYWGFEMCDCYLGI